MTFRLRFLEEDDESGDGRNASRRRGAGTGAGWKRSSYCSAGVCVEVEFRSDLVAVRDSKQINMVDQPILQFSYSQWQTLLRKFEIAVDGFATPFLIVERRGDGWVQAIHTQSDVRLNFDAEEWRAFLLGVRNGEFDPACADSRLVANQP